jgi:hypothetical protein
MPAAYCGVYPSRRGCLVAVAVDSSGRASPPARATRTDDGRYELLLHLETISGLDIELVVPDWVARLDSIAQLAAAARNIPVWIVPMPLVDALRVVARAGPPARVAALIARLPLALGLREQLRRIRPADRRQLTMPFGLLSKICG